jgi:sterol desaturase/sphingolipid hydroxylase (fatty acid hydroxylase superfamily)
VVEIEQVEASRSVKPPLVMRARLLLTVGWTLLLLALGLLSFHALWMWKRMGRGAPFVAIALVLDALVGIGLIYAGNKLRRK